MKKWTAWLKAVFLHKVHWLAGLFLFELILQTYGIGDLGPFIQPTVYFILILAYTWLLFDLSTSKVENKGLFSFPPSRILRYAIPLTALILLVFFIIKLDILIAHRPIDPGVSDIIPSIQQYVERFLANTPVYVPLEMPGYFVQPTYLPMMWLPYLLPELLGIDYRWLPALIFFGVAAFILGKRAKTYLYLPAVSSLGLLWPFLAAFLLMLKDAAIFANTVELMIAGFYLFLCAAMTRKTAWLMAIGLVACLLSRYALIFWLLPFGMVIYEINGFRFLLRVGLWALLGILGIYLIPYFLPDPTVFSKGLEYYTGAAIHEWQPKSWQSENDLPFSIARGFGSAIYFYAYIDDSLEQKVALIQLVHKIIVIVCPVGLAVGFILLRNKIINWRFYLVFSLKIYLMLFYFFIQVPYSYLFITPLLISGAVLLELTSEKNLPYPPNLSNRIIH